MQKARLLLESLRARGIEVYLEDGQLRYRARAGDFREADRAAIRAVGEELKQVLGVEFAIPKLRAEIPAANEQPQLSGQQRVWIIACAKGAPSQTLTLVTPLWDAPYDLVCAAVRQMLLKHQVLCYRFSRDIKVDRPFLNNPKEFVVEPIFVESLDEESLERCATQFFQHQIEIHDDWLIKAAHISGPSNESFLLIATNHAVVDGGSFEILSDDIRSLLSRPDRINGDAMMRTHTEYTDWDWKISRSEVGEAIRDYWSYWKQTVPDLRHPRTGEILAWRRGRLLSGGFVLAPNDYVPLKMSALRSGITPLTLLVATVALGLSEWSGQTRFSIRSYGNLRDRQELSATVGPMFCFDYLEIDDAGAVDALTFMRRVADEYRYAASLRLPSVEPNSTLSMLGGRMLTGATVNYFARMREQPRWEKTNRIFDEHDSIDLNLSTLPKLRLQGLVSPYSPINLMAADTGHGLMLKFEFNDDQLTAQDCEEILHLFKKHWNVARRAIRDAPRETRPAPAHSASPS